MNQGALLYLQKITFSRSPKSLGPGSSPLTYSSNNTEPQKSGRLRHGSRNERFRSFVFNSNILSGIGRSPKPSPIITITDATGIISWMSNSNRFRYLQTAVALPPIFANMHNWTQIIDVCSYISIKSDNNLQTIPTTATSHCIYNGYLYT